MFDLYADKNKLTVREKELVTSGSVNAYRVRFEFSDDWDGLDKTGVFMAGCAPVYVLLDNNGECAVPAEVLIQPGRYLMAGVYGRRGEDLVLPTVWANLGMILEGAAVSEPSVPPTPELWEQALDRKGDRLAYTEDGELGLYSGEKMLSSVPIEGGGEGGPVYQFGHGLKVTGRTVLVDAVDDFGGDNTLPMTAAGVYATVGNIEALLGTI